jgi:hypothetical protein
LLKTTNNYGNTINNLFKTQIKIHAFLCIFIHFAAFFYPCMPVASQPGHRLFLPLSVCFQAIEKPAPGRQGRKKIELKYEGGQDPK